jgi:hypothetical protein
MSKRLLGVLLSFCLAACSSVGPTMVPRDRVDYVDAIGTSWEQQTLLNIVKLRYGHAPVFLGITQVVTGYQFQSTVGAGLTASSFTAVSNTFVLTGVATAQGQYTDRPTVIYSPLTGVDFLQKLMTPIPPSTILFVLQAGYNADMIMPLALDSINGIYNSARRGMGRSADARFDRMVQLIRDLQLAEAMQVRIERPKEGSETSLMTFPPTKNPQAMVESRAVRSILGLSPTLEKFKVYYGGYSGGDDEIAMMTRSMLQVMLELAAGVQVAQADVAQDRAAPGQVKGQASETQSLPAVNILSGNTAPSNASVAVQYDHQWFWIADTDFRSKAVFGTVMLLFSISDVGMKGGGPIVTVPANG